MAKAIWEGTVLAESNQCVEVEGNQYFPPDAIKSEHFKPSATHTVCPWKGTASYYDVEVAGGACFDPGGNLEPVHRAPGEGLEHEDIEGATQDREGLGYTHASLLTGSV